MPAADAADSAADQPKVHRQSAQAVDAAAAEVADLEAACSPEPSPALRRPPMLSLLREHYSLVELPDGNFQPRYDDPRAGYGGLNFVDYSVPIGEPMVKRYIRRHRLEKKDPNAAISEAVKPDPILG